MKIKKKLLGIVSTYKVIIRLKFIRIKTHNILYFYSDYAYDDFFYP